jgi:hypothetical protein
VHDFRLFKESKTAILPSIESLTDSGYQGIQKIHANCVKPVKGTKKKPLTKEDKKHNHHLVSCQFKIVGYNLFNFILASLVVNCQLITAFLLFR